MTGPQARAGLEELVDRLLVHANQFDDGTEWQLLLRPETYALLDGAGINAPEDGQLGYRFRPAYKDTELWVVDLLGDVIAAGPLSMPHRPTAPMFWLDLADPTGRVRNNDDESLVEHLHGG